MRWAGGPRPPGGGPPRGVWTATLDGHACTLFLLTIPMTDAWHRRYRRCNASRPPRGGPGPRGVRGPGGGSRVDCVNILALLTPLSRGLRTPAGDPRASAGDPRAPAGGPRAPGGRGVDARPASPLTALAAARGRAKAPAGPGRDPGAGARGPRTPGPQGPLGPKGRGRGRGRGDPWRPVTLARLGGVPVGPTYAPWMASLWQGPWLRRPPVAVAEAVVPRRVVLPPRGGPGEGAHPSGWRAAARARDASFAAVRASRPGAGPRVLRGGPALGAGPREARVRVAADGRLDALLTRGLPWGLPGRPQGSPRGGGGGPEGEGPPAPRTEPAASVAFGGPEAMGWREATVLPATAAGYGAYWRWAVAWCNAHSPRELLAVVMAGHRVRWEAPTAFQAPVPSPGPGRASRAPRAPRPPRASGAQGALDEGDMPRAGPTGAWHPAAALIPGEMARRARKTRWKRGPGGPARGDPLGAAEPHGGRVPRGPGPQVLVGALGSVVPAGRGRRLRRALEAALGAALAARGPAAGAPPRSVQGAPGGAPGGGFAEALVRAGVAGFVHPRTGWGVSRTPWRPVPAGDTKAPGARAPRTYVRGSGRHTWVRGRVPVTNPGPRLPYRLDADRVDLLGPDVGAGADAGRGLPLWWRVRRAVPKPVLPGWLRWHEAARRAAVPGRAPVLHVQGALEGLRPDAAAILGAAARLRLHRLAPGEAAAQMGLGGPWRVPYPYQVRPDDPRPRREHPDWRRSRDVPTVRARGMRPPVAWSPGFYGHEGHARGWLEAVGGAPAVPTPHRAPGAGAFVARAPRAGRTGGTEGTEGPGSRRPRPQALEAIGVAPGPGAGALGPARRGAPGAWRMTAAGWAVPGGPWALPEEAALHAAFGPVGTAARVHGMGGVLLRRAARFGEDPLARQRLRTWSAAYRARREAKAARWLPLKPGFAFPTRYTGFLAASTASFLPTDPQALAEGPDPGARSGPRGGPDGPLHPAWVRLRAYRPLTGAGGAGPLGGGPGAEGLRGGRPSVVPWTPWAPEAVGPGPKGHGRVRPIVAPQAGPVAAPDRLDRAGGPMAWAPPAPAPGGSGREPLRWSPRGPVGPKGWATWVRPDAQAAGMAQVAAAMFPPEAGPRGPEAGPRGAEAGSRGAGAGPRGSEGGPEGTRSALAYPTPEALVPAAVGVRAPWLLTQGPPATLGPVPARALGGTAARFREPSRPGPQGPEAWRVPAPAEVEGARRGPKPATAWRRFLAAEVARVWMVRFGVTDPWRTVMPTALRQAWEGWAARQVRRRRRGRYPRVPRPRRVARLHALGFGTWQRPRWFRAGRIKKPRRTGYAYAYGPSDPRGGVRALAPVGLSPYAPRHAATALVTEATPLAVWADDGTPVPGAGARVGAPEAPRAVRAYTRAGRLGRPFGVGRDGPEAAWWGVPAPAVGLDPGRVAAFTVPGTGGWYARPDGRRAPGRPLAAGWLPGQSPYTPRTRTNAPGFMAVWDPGPAAGLLAPLWEALGRWRMARVLRAQGPRKGPLRGPGPGRGGVRRGVGAEVLAQPAAFLAARPVGHETPLTGAVGAYGPRRRPAHALQRRAAKGGWAWGTGGRRSPYAALARAATVPHGPRGPRGPLGPRGGPAGGPWPPGGAPGGGGAEGTVMGLKAAGYTGRRRALGGPSRRDAWPLAPEGGSPGAVALLETLGLGRAVRAGGRAGPRPRRRRAPWGRAWRARRGVWGRVPGPVAAIDGYARAREGTWTYGALGDPYPEGRWVHVRYPGDGALTPLGSRAAEALGAPDPFAVDLTDEGAAGEGLGSEAGPALPRGAGSEGPSGPGSPPPPLAPEAQEAKAQREAARKAVKAAAVAAAVTRLRGEEAPFRNRPFVPGPRPQGDASAPRGPRRGPQGPAAPPSGRGPRGRGGRGGRGVGWEPAREVRAYLHGVGRRAWQAAPRKASKYTATSRPGAIRERAWAVFGPTAPGRRRRLAGWHAYQGAGARRRARRRALDRRVEGPGGVAGLDRAWRTQWLPGYAWAPWPAFLLRLRRHWLAWATVGPLGRVAEATRQALWERQGRAWAFKAGAQARRWVRLWEVGGDVAYLHAVARQRREWEVLGASVAAARVRWWRRRRGAWVRGLLGAVQLHRILAIKLAWRRWAHTARLRAHAIRLRDRARRLRRATARRVGLAGPGGRGEAAPATALVAVSPVLPGGMAAQAPMWAAWQGLLGDRIDDAATAQRALAPLVGAEGPPAAQTAAERGARGPTPLPAWGWDDGALPPRARVYPFDPLGPGNVALVSLWAHVPRAMGAVAEAGPGPAGGVTPWAFVGPDGRTWVPLAGAPVRAVAVYRPAVTAVARVPGARVRTLGHDPAARAAVVPTRRAGENPYVAAAADLTPRWLRMPRHVRDDPALARAMAVVGTADRNLTTILSAWYRRRALLATPGDLYHLARRPLTLDET